MTSLIAYPDLPYSELAARLRALDWEWRNESEEMPTIPGEPEWVLWGREDSETGLVYSFNPAVRLRVLDFSGADAEKQRGRVASFLPHLMPGDVTGLLMSGETESVLLGLFAAGELALPELRGPVALLTENGDELVARVAARVMERIPAPHIQDLPHSLFGQDPPVGDRLGIFAQIIDAGIRRQAIRVARREVQDEERIALEFLADVGLRDPDWEVRASAMLVAARSGLGSLARAVADLELPLDDRFGHSPLDLSRLETLRVAALGVLSDQTTPSDLDARHARDCVLGQVQGRCDGLFLLAYSLTTPFHPGSGPDALPPGIQTSDDGFMLAKSRLPLAWIAPVPCWLGDADGGGELPNPLRHIVPSTGFFIARRPLSRATLDWILSGGKGPGGLADGDAAADHLCALQDGKQIVAWLGEIEGEAIGLASADQWEIAARGSDGRRYPWGNGIEPDAEQTLSPRSLERIVGEHPHWTTTEDGGPVACGGPDPRCDRRRVHRGEGLIRPIVLLPQA